MKRIHVIKEARQYPIHECLINPAWREMGHARVLLSRKMPHGKFVFGVYLVDLYCLGIKDVFLDADSTQTVYETQIKPMIYTDGQPITCDLNLGHTIIYGGAHYARTLGFDPHEDFELGAHILKNENNITVDPSVAFGKDGKPMYIQGPYDDVKQIIHTLEITVGRGNFIVSS